MWVVEKKKRRWGKMREQKGGTKREIDESLREMVGGFGGGGGVRLRSLALKLFYLMVLRGTDGHEEGAQKRIKSEKTARLNNCHYIIYYIRSFFFFFFCTTRRHLIIRPFFVITVLHFLLSCSTNIHVLARILLYQSAPVLFFSPLCWVSHQKSHLPPLDK